MTLEEAKEPTRDVFFVKMPQRFVDRPWENCEGKESGLRRVGLALHVDMLGKEKSLSYVTPLCGGNH